MDIRKVLQDIVWIKPWRSARETGASSEALALVREAAAQRPPEPSVELLELIAASKRFPLLFPIDTIRLEKLQSRCEAQRLVANAQSTYPLMHERVVLLIASFILYKSKDGWEAVGTEQEIAPLLLKNCLSYDEMKLSALLCVSGHTECINDGARKNSGVVCADGVEPNAVIIGIIGARFKRPSRMEAEDILVTPAQNVPANGYGGAATDAARRAYRKLWEDFYQIPSTTYSDLPAEAKPVGEGRGFGSRWVRVRDAGFDNLAYCRRTQVTAETVLLEADARARERGTVAFVNVIGAGLGIWKHSIHQIDAYVLSVLRGLVSLLDAGNLQHVADVNFAYIQPKKEVLELFTSNKGDCENVKSMFIKNVNHPKGGISVWLESREPASKLVGEHAGKLLVLTYAWDSNALPGNEFWLGKLSSSGDSAAACSTQVAELHNAHINPSVCGANTHVAGHAAGLTTLQDYCERMLHNQA